MPNSKPNKIRAYPPQRPSPAMIVRENILVEQLSTKDGLNYQLKDLDLPKGISLKDVSIRFQRSENTNEYIVELIASVPKYVPDPGYFYKLEKYETQMGEWKKEKSKK